MADPNALSQSLSEIPGQLIGLFTCEEYWANHVRQQVAHINDLAARVADARVIVAHSLSSEPREIEGPQRARLFHTWRERTSYTHIAVKLAPLSFHDASFLGGVQAPTRKLEYPGQAIPDLSLPLRDHCDRCFTIRHRVLVYVLARDGHVVQYGKECIQGVLGCEEPELRHFLVGVVQAVWNMTLWARLGKKLRKGCHVHQFIYNVSSPAPHLGFDFH